MNLPKHLHIALASDNNYAEFVAIVITSLFSTNQNFEKITIHLLANGISQETINQLKRLIPNKGELCIYDMFNISDRLQITVPSTIAITAYSRLFLSTILPKNVKKVLYVDCDIIFNNDISDLWNIDMTTNSIAGVLDTLPDNGSKMKIGLSCNCPYFNSGVLLINLDFWREFNIEQKFIDFLLSHNGKVHHHDQGIINAVCKDKLILHPRYNLTSTYLSHPYWLLAKTNCPFYSESEVSDAIINPAIIHFTEGFYNRPWIANSKHPLANIFEKYWNFANWGKIIYRPDKRSAAVKILSWSFLNLPYWLYKLISNSISFMHKFVKK